MSTQNSEAVAVTQASTGPADQALAPDTPKTVPHGRTMLRLLAPPGGVGLLLDAPVVAQHARGQGRARRLDSIYYDSADLLLFRSRLSFCVRKQGRRFVQVLKRQRPVQHAFAGLEDGLASDWAWEVPVDTGQPDLSRFAGLDGAAAPVVEQMSTVPLVRIFETKLRRQVRHLELPGAVIDAIIDEGVIEAQARQEPVAEIRLMLQAGDAGMLHEIGMRLLEVATLRVGTSGKVLRGYGLASGAPPRAEKAARSLFRPDLAADDLIAAVITGCQEHLEANQAVAEDGRNPDGVHQTRVALRRLRTALSLFHREIPAPSMRALSAEAKWLADECGQARGWDVFLASTLTEPERVRSAGADFAELRQAVEAPRAAAYSTVRAAVASPRCARFELSLGQWIARRGWRNEVGSDGLAILAEPASIMAVRVLSRLRRKALRRGRHFKRLSAEERHELRITLKKLRYAVEFFLPLLGESAQAEQYLRRLSGLQDALGLDHDAATTQPLLDEIGRTSRSCAVHQAIGLVAGWQAHEALAIGDTLARRWKQFKALPPFWVATTMSAERKLRVVTLPQ